MTAILEEVVRTRLLKIAASDLMAWNLRGNRKDRHTIAVAIEEAIDEVKVAGAATARTHGDVSSEVGFRAGGERSYLFMPHMEPFDLAPDGSHL